MPTGTRGPAVFENCITHALSFLVGSQQKDGGFPINRHDFSGVVLPEDALFATALVLLSVGELLPAPCRFAALTLLRERRGTDGYWHFDPAGILPPDADDTACALAALKRFAPAAEQPTAGDFERLAAFVRPDGRIATWLATDRLADIDTDDLVVAGNVIYAMALADAARAQQWLIRWLSRFPTAMLSDQAETHIDSPDPAPATPYYIQYETIGYVWARALRALNMEPPEQGVPCDVLGSPLRCAQRLLASDAQCEELTTLLLDSQDPEGYWVEEPFFCSLSASFGSHALTTALAIEALDRVATRVRA